MQVNLSKPSVDSNPLIEVPDPYVEMRRNQEEMARLHPEMLEQERLAYETFIMFEHGKKLMERWEKHILMSSSVNAGHPHAQQISFFNDAIRSFIISIKTQALNHQMRIQAP